MDRNLDHFELSVWSEPLPRRSRGWAPPPSRDNREQHGRQLVRQAEEIAHRLQTRQDSAPPGINPKLVFRLALHPKGTLSIPQLSQMGLQILAVDSRRAMVVFPDRPTLDALRGRLREYAGMVSEGHQYAFLAAIEAIEDLSPEDRTGARLANRPLAPDEIAPFRC